jgi:hypothetical protein
MKNLLVFFVLALCCTWLSAFAGIDGVIKFAKASHAFGKVKQSQPATVNFEFVNPGSTPLIIEDATAECGCTKPTYPMQPIMPGKKGAIKVTYDAKELGSFTKKITVKLVNQPETKLLTISGEVVK